MRILGIDPSLKSTGVCLPSGECLTVKTSDKWPAWGRIDTILKGCSDAIERTLPDLVVIEECIIGIAPHMPSIWLHGLLRHDTLSVGIPYVDVHSSRRQKFACGDQKERDKDALIIRAKDLGATIANNDECDAWWLARVGRTAYGDYEGDLPKFRREVVAAIDWPEIRGVKPVWSGAPSKSAKKK